MYIIKLQPNSSGSRPPLQSWSNLEAPEGFALCPDKYFNTFYLTDPAGFVNIKVENNMVIDMTINQEALDAYITSSKITEEVLEPTQLDRVEAQITYTAMMTNTLLEV